MMLELIERIRDRLAHGAYVNEAAISHGIVTPMLNALGWDSADPDQLVPEFSIQRGRIDFALFGLGHRPAVFIEVKGIGRAMDGDRQLFEYAFHQGVPLCVLTDGREWSFYVPSGHGSYDDRRVYRLQLDDRDPAECQRILNRYLARDRVRDGSAFEDAQRDYRDAAGRREAVIALPRAWTDLMAEPDDVLIDAVGDKAEALCGFKPSAADVLAFLRRLRPEQAPPAGEGKKRTATTAPPASPPPSPSSTGPYAKTVDPGTSVPNADGIRFTLLGKTYEGDTAARALIQILAVLAERDPDRVEELAAAVRGRSRSMIARSVTEINPTRPDLARAAEFAPGWLVGLNLSNRDKMGIIRTACDVFGITMPDELDIKLPNAS